MIPTILWSHREEAVAAAAVRRKLTSKRDTNLLRLMMYELLELPSVNNRHNNNRVCVCVCVCGGG